MSEFADVTDLAGRPFFARSGNGGVVKLLGESGIQMTWRSRPSDEDREQFFNWAERVLGYKLNAVEHMAGKISEDPDLRKSHAAYAEFLRSSEGE